MGVALFNRGIIRRPSLAHSCSFLLSPVRLKIQNTYLVASYVLFFTIVDKCFHAKYYMVLELFFVVRMLEMIT